MRICDIHNGMVWFNNINVFASMGVPKCVSSGVREQFGLYETTDIRSIRDKKVFSVVRNPIHRYVSGYIEAMKPCQQFPKGRYWMVELPIGLKDKLDKLFIDNISEIERFKKYTDLIKEYGYFEPHIVKQVDYLRELNTKEFYKGVNVFKLEYPKNIEEFIGCKLEKRNTSEYPILKKELIGFYNINIEYKNLIDDLYKEDVDFYNSFDEKIIL